MNTKTPIIALLLAVSLILAGCSSAIPNQTTNQTNTSVDESQTTTYVSTDLEQCKVIRYMCINGKEPFSDAGGCGCRPVSQVQFPDGQTEDVFYVATNVTVCAATTFLCDADKQMFFNESGCGCKTPAIADEPKKTYCTPEQKNATICTMEYRQVCGWFGENVKCVKFPCAIEAANPCGACATQNVEYYTEGACPTNPPAQTQTSSQLMEPINPNKACTMDYTPVCALFDDGNSVTIGNACGASNIKGVVSTKPGECQTPTQAEPKRVVYDCDQSYIDMQNDSVAACTKEYMPVCASGSDGVANTFGNKCGACTTKGVTQYTQGACNDGTGAVI